MEPEITYMENLILNGALEVAGLSEDGSFTYRFTEKLDEVDPELKDKIEHGFYEAVMHLWSLDFLVVQSDDGEAKVTISEKALDSSAVSGLEVYYQKILALIIEALQKQ